MISWRMTPKPLAWGRVSAIHRAWRPLQALDAVAFSEVLRARPPSAARLLSRGEGARAFAVVAELIRRDTGCSLRDNQLACALELLGGRCVELDTGEGKTLAAALAALVAARSGVSVHVVTVNDYLAKRDHALIAPLAARLGLESAVLVQDTPDEEKALLYNSDILYAANKTLVFDHLRDLRETRVFPERAPRQMGQALAIVDEADSVLIDDATVPMILSETADALPDEDLALFRAIDRFVVLLHPDHDIARDAQGNLRLSVSGLRRLEIAAQGWAHPLARTDDIVSLADAGLMARYGLLEGQTYLVRDGQLVIIDPSTGRLMPDRRWSYGLQQLVEIAAGLNPSGETATVAQVTQQTYFRQYRCLSGLTGTARECGPEFWSVYRMPVQRIAPHLPSKRHTGRVRIFGRAAAKWDVVCTRAIEIARTRAVLIGVNHVNEVRALEARFAAQGKDVAVLDALTEDREAEVVGRAGALGQITIATHLAGRGTDIPVAQEVLEAGGLHVMVASFMASARLARQLAGRTARQGQAGSVETFVARDDPGLADQPPGLATLFLTLRLRLRLHPRGALASLQDRRDRQGRRARRKTLLREQDLQRKLGYGQEIT